MSPGLHRNWYSSQTASGSLGSWLRVPWKITSVRSLVMLKRGNCTVEVYLMDLQMSLPTPVTPWLYCTCQRPRRCWRCGAARTTCSSSAWNSAGSAPRECSGSQSEPPEKRSPPDASAYLDYKEYVHTRTNRKIEMHEKHALWIGSNNVLANFNARNCSCLA